MKTLLHQLNVHLMTCASHCLVFQCCETDFHIIHFRLYVHMWSRSCLWASLRMWITGTPFVSSAHLDLERQMRFGETLICSTGICVLRLSVHAAWILDKLFYTPVKWLSNTTAVEPSLTWRDALSFFSCFTSFWGSSNNKSSKCKSL